MAATPFPELKPFPGQAEAPVATIGHNKPPLDESVIADFEEGLRSIDGLVPRIEALIARGNVAEPCETEEMAGRYGDYLKMVRTIAGTGGIIETEREKHNRPLLNAQRALKARADGLINKLNTAAGKVRRHLDAYMDEQRRKADQARREAEEQAQAAREAAEAERQRQAEAREAAGEPAFEEVGEPIPTVEIAPAVVDEPVVRGDYGARVGSTTVWKHEIISVRQVPDRYLKHPKVVEALDKVIAAAIRTEKVREIKGVRIWDDQQTVVR